MYKDTTANLYFVCSYKVINQNILVYESTCDTTEQHTYIRLARIYRVDELPPVRWFGYGRMWTTISARMINDNIVRPVSATRAMSQNRSFHFSEQNTNTNEKSNIWNIIQQNIPAPRNDRPTCVYITIIRESMLLRWQLKLFSGK